MKYCNGRKWSEIEWRFNVVMGRWHGPAERLMEGRRELQLRLAFAIAGGWACLIGMRISGGQARGIPLLVPKGDAVRPATDGMRQAVFSSLGARVEGARFLDLFAGSGAYGLEALSRGASSGTWVEKHARTAALLRQNVDSVCRSLGRSDRMGLVVIAGDATTAPWADPNLPPDLVFVDPPYPIIGEVAPWLFERLGVLLAPDPDALVVFEMPGGTDLAPVGWECVKRIGKGVRQPTVAIFRREGGRR